MALGAPCREVRGVRAAQGVQGDTWSAEWGREGTEEAGGTHEEAPCRASDTPGRASETPGRASETPVRASEAPGTGSLGTPGVSGTPGG